MTSIGPGAVDDAPVRISSTPIVELRDVFCVHRTSEGDAAPLQGSTLAVGRGELLCVLGPSGAGKSTLLHVIAGLQTPSAGEVRVFGRDMGRSPARLRSKLRHEKIGFLPQRSEFAFSPDLRICAAVSLPLALRGVGRRARCKRSTELLESAGLRDRSSAIAAELSGGERQRVALCAALAHGPELLLADEPTGELDEASAQALRELIVALARAQGASAIVVSHDPAMAVIADRALRIRDGRVVADRHDGEEALVVDRGGWVQLPRELLANAEIADRARVRTAAGGLIVTPATRASAEGARVAGADDGLRSVREESSSLSDGSRRPAQIELLSVTRARGQGAGSRLVIDRLTRTIAAGRMTAVTGRSGTGKTTLLRLLAGLDKPNAGELLIDGIELGGCDDEQLALLRRARIGYLPQEPSPIGFLSAEENVVLALRLRDSSPDEAAARAAVVLARLALADRARQRVSRLSAGEAQRVALARALASARGLLIVDEPTSRLDEAGAVAVAELLADAAAVDRQTVICATHDEQVIKRADEVLPLT